MKQWTLLVLNDKLVQVKETNDRKAQEILIASQKIND